VALPELFDPQLATPKTLTPKQRLQILSSKLLLISLAVYQNLTFTFFQYNPQSKNKRGVNMTFEEAAKNYPVLDELKDTLEAASLVKENTDLHKIAVYFIRKDTDAFKKLIDQGFDVNAKETGDFGSPLLHTTIRFDNMDAFKYLIDKGADINAVDNINYSPLIEAVVDGRLEFGKALVDLGADKTIANTMGATAAALANKFGRFEFLPILG
jgi:ankyrin repeat protein